MMMKSSEDELVGKSIAYLKARYGEDTVDMRVVKNDVVNDSGVLEVDCTVRIGGDRSAWTKWFRFENGVVVSMDWKMR